MKRKPPRLQYAIFALFAVLVPLTTYTQIITTYAGSDEVVILGDGGPATDATLKSPAGLVFDPAGNLLIAETAGYRVRRVNAAGIISTVAGSGIFGAFGGDGGPATGANIYAVDVACDGVGNIYIHDLYHCRIRKVDVSGIISTVAGNGVCGVDSGDGGPATNAVVSGNLDVDEVGNIYIAGTGHVRKVDATTGIITTIIGSSITGFSGDGGPATAAEFGGLSDVAVHRSGNIYVLDRNNYRVRKINTAGIATTVAGSGGIGFSGDGGPATDATFNINMQSLFVDEAECIYIVDMTNRRIRKVNASGIITTIAGDGTTAFTGDGGPAIAAGFTYPRYVVKKKGGGNIFVADRNCNRVRMITDMDHPAYFTGGHGLSRNICVLPTDTGATAIYIDTLLTAADADTGQAIKWQLVHAPHHGTASASYAALTTASTLVPSGLTYTPVAGYIGLDTFVVRVTDFYSADTATVYIRVDGPANAGIVAGPDTVCKGSSITLISTVAGGVFSSTTGKVSVTGSSITGATAGLDTILYVVTNTCGRDTAMHVVSVRDCSSGIPHVAGGEGALRIWPNPASGTLSMQLSANDLETAHVTMTNVVGQGVKEITTTTNRQTDIALDIPPGVYFIAVSTAHDRWMQKLLVE